MAHISLLTLLLATAAFPSFGFRLPNSSNYHWLLQDPEQLDSVEHEPLFGALVYPDGRPTQVLIDNLGDPEDFRYQLGDPVSTPYPFIGGLGTITHFENGTLSYFIHCAASLIARQSVVTAAHCLSPKEKNVTDIFVHGLTDLKVRSKEELEEKEKHFAEIKFFTPHPQFKKKPSTLLNDVAVGRLVKNLDSTNSKAKPICLGSPEKYNKKVVGAGWGYKNCQRSSKETLRKAKSTLVPYKECKRNYRSDILKQHICTFFETTDGEPAASASGDSGGPLFSLAKPNNPVKIGLTSYSSKQVYKGKKTKCTNKFIPMVFTRLASFKDFIDKLAPNAQWC